MFVNKDGISPNLESRAEMSKKFGLVIAIARRVNGIIFARSWERCSLTYAVILTAATRAAEMRRTVEAVVPSARTRIRIANTVNQKNVRIGKMMRYSMM